uniref:uncharacterized protein LOC122608306 n=1 Tax=Erigeron canadensis TaxID=72917 RepID=UPI001CB8BA44|nr:uncharacterized protein LOC122608306 [Erigeron canadensis]
MMIKIFNLRFPTIEHVNSWSLPIISLTCITIALPNIEKDRVDDLFKSVGEGLLYTHLVEKILNKESMYVNIRRATLELWHEVEVNHKWLNNTLERNAYKEKTPRDIITSFAQIAENVLDEFINTSSTNGDHLMENENLPPKVIVANSMYRIAKTIESNNSNIVDEEELFTQLCGMIADILATCFTNIPRAISMRCHESTVIEEREARVAAAIDFLGRTTEIIERLENRRLPNMDHEKMAYIDEWRLHFKRP